MTYIEQRNRLIPLAEIEANRCMRKKLIKTEKREHKGQVYIHDFWSEYFHRAMDKMMRRERRKA
jgi:hypothetical protein